MISRDCKTRVDWSILHVPTWDHESWEFLLLNNPLSAPPSSTESSPWHPPSSDSLLFSSLKTVRSVLFPRKTLFFGESSRSSSDERSPSSVNCRSTSPSFKSLLECRRDSPREEMEKLEYNGEGEANQ